MRILTNRSKREKNRSRSYNDGTWSSAVIQTILAGCAKKKRKTDISNGVFVATPLQRLFRAAVTRECGDSASPMRHDEIHGVVTVTVVVDDTRKYRYNEWIRNEKSKTMPRQCIGRCQNMWEVHDNNSGSENRIFYQRKTGHLSCPIPCRNKPREKKPIEMARNYFALYSRWTCT